MKKKFWLLLLPLLYSLTLFAQMNSNGSFSIKGQVVDSLLNETVPYVTLNITKASEPDKSVKRLACDIDGRFETTLAEPGEYVIAMQSVGKVSSQKSFTLNGDRKTVDLGRLNMEEDRQRLEEVTVVAQKPLVKVEIDKLTYSMEDDPESETNNTLDMLRKVPMVTVDAEDKIQLKGTSNYRIYLNGKPSNMLSSENTSDVLKSMPASSVKNIEVITDPGAKYDADGVGGIINIITSRNALQGYTASVRAGVSALGRYNAGGNFSTKVGKLGITANYNYNNYRNPWNDSEYYRETYGEEESTVFKQNGRSKNNNGHQYGSLEVSYELDSLNLLSLGANMWRGNYKSKSELDVRAMQGDARLYEYDQFTESQGNYGSMDMNLDYQHSTSKKDELLTISYRFSHSPNDNKGYTSIEEILNYTPYRQRNINDASTQEHTAQVDYTTPLPKNQTLEAGAKYIMRESSSDTEMFRQEGASTTWVDYPRPESYFSHIQHIYAAYMGYAAKWKSFGFKAGVRAEGTALNVKYKHSPVQDFKSDFFNVVPNATLSYQINMSQTIRLGYNMRIYRPGIWYLNPYENDTDPQNVSYGNPNLDPEKSHTMNLNYSLFNMKFNLNVGAHYRYLNNSILRYSFIDNDHPVYPGRMVSTFDNLGKEQGGRYVSVRPLVAEAAVCRLCKRRG